MKMKYEKSGDAHLTPCPFSFGACGNVAKVGSAACAVCIYNNYTGNKYVDCHAWEDHFSKLVAEEEDEPNLGDFCKFWDDNEKSSCRYDFLEAIHKNDGDGFPFMTKQGQSWRHARKVTAKELGL